MNTPSFQVTTLQPTSPGETRVSVTLSLPAHFTQETVDQTIKAATVAAEYLALFSRKQEAYGVGNIDGFGELGVLVRLNDKIERLKNLLYHKRSSDLESVADTWDDVIGYGIIGGMVHRGLWRGPLPVPVKMEEPSIKTVPEPQLNALDLRAIIDAMKKGPQATLQPIPREVADAALLRDKHDALITAFNNDHLFLPKTELELYE